MKTPLKNIFVLLVDPFSPLDKLPHFSFYSTFARSSIHIFHRKSSNKKHLLSVRRESTPGVICKVYFWDIILICTRVNDWILMHKAVTPISYFQIQRNHSHGSFIQFYYSSPFLTLNVCVPQQLISPCKCFFIFFFVSNGS